MLKWVKRGEIQGLKDEIAALKAKMTTLEAENYCLKALPAFLFDDPELLWNAIWKDVDEGSVIGYAISSSLAVKLLKSHGIAP